MNGNEKKRNGKKEKRERITKKPDCQNITATGTKEMKKGKEKGNRKKKANRIKGRNMENEKKGFTAKALSTGRGIDIVELFPIPLKTPYSQHIPGFFDGHHFPYQKPPLNRILVAGKST